MKNSVLIMVLGMMLMNAPIFAQDVKESEEYKRNLEIYNRSKAYGDPMVSRMALYELIALDPSAVTLLDSLAFLYYNYNSYASALLVTRNILEINPENILMLELNAICYENLGIRDRALDSYEALYLKSNSSVTLYRIAFLQYDLSRLAEAATNADILLEREDVAELQVSYSRQDQTEYSVPMNAAVHNLKGMIAKQSGDNAAARESFQAALSIMPEFELATENLNSLEG